MQRLGNLAALQSLTRQRGKQSQFVRQNRGRCAKDHDVIAHARHPDLGLAGQRL
jgi:hypothetical protein